MNDAISAQPTSSAPITRRKQKNVNHNVFILVGVLIVLLCFVRLVLGVSIFRSTNIFITLIDWMNGCAMLFFCCCYIRSIIKLKYQYNVIMKCETDVADWKSEKPLRDSCFFLLFFFLFRWELHVSYIYLIFFLWNTIKNETLHSNEQFKVF